MIFQVDEKEKKKATKLINSKIRSASEINKIIKLIMLTSLISAINYVFLKLLIPGFGMISVNGVLKLDYPTIIYTPIEIVFIGFIISLFLTALRNNISSANSGERIHEEIRFINNEITYTFRIPKYQTDGKDRLLIVIPLNSVSSVNYNQAVRSITLHGQFLSEYILDDANPDFITPVNVNLSEFIIYNYFNPGLLDFIKSKGFNISEDII